MTIKLVAVDLDDTLLDTKLKISPRAAKAIQQAVSQGVMVTVATGRMYQSALPYAKQLALDVPLITYNGALIKAGLSGDTMFHQPIPSEVSAEILAFCRERDWHIQLYVDDQLYVKEMNEKASKYVKIAGVQAHVMGDELYEIKKAPTKMLAIDHPENIPAIAEAINSILKDKVYMTNSKPNFLEFTHPDVNKGLALGHLADMFDIKKEEVMAIGDSGNDLPMIEYAGLGVAMGNAREKIKAAAQVVTKNSDDDGVAEAIEKYVLGI